MPIKKQNKKTPVKTTKLKETKRTNSLNEWLFKKPILFALLTFLTTFITTLVYATIITLLDSKTVWPLTILLIACFCWTIYYQIKKLPHDDMFRSDFIAITNGAFFITISIPLLTLMFIGNDVQTLKYEFMWLYMMHPAFMWFMVVSLLLLYLYLLGVAISGIYAKYKRACQIGISKWKVILSMPFTFLLMWTPGYLVSDKKTESKIQIKTKWFNRFNKWVLSDSTNALIVFLALILLRNVFSGTATLLFTAFLLVIYLLWNVKHKSTFIKNINNGYALTAVGINIITCIIVIIMLLNYKPY